MTITARIHAPELPAEAVWIGVVRPMTLKSLRGREPTGLCQLESGQVIVADSHHHRVLVIDAATRRAKPLPVGGTP